MSRRPPLSESWRLRLREVGAVGCLADILEDDPGDRAIPWERLVEEFVKQLPPGSMGSVKAVLGHPSLTPFLQTVLNARPAGYDLICNAVSLAWHAVHHERGGRQVYEVSPGLATMLRLTELRGLSCDDVRLLFSAIAVLPPSAAQLFLPIPAGPLPIGEVYVVEEPAPDRAWRVMFVAACPDGSVGIERLTIPLFSGTTIDDSIEAVAARLEAGGNAELFDGWKLQFRWLMNVVMYASSEGTREEVWRNSTAVRLRLRIEKLPPGKKRDRLRQDLRKLDLQRRIVLGPEVRAPVRLMEHRSHKSLLTRVHVQGHWRRHPCGPAHSLRKLIWIQPYWRGPEDLAADCGRDRVLV